jgi:hypothetical protein
MFTVASLSRTWGYYMLSLLGTRRYILNKNRTSRIKELRQNFDTERVQGVWSSGRPTLHVGESRTQAAFRTCALLGYYAAFSGGSPPTFRDDLSSVPTSSLFIRNPQVSRLNFWREKFLEIQPICVQFVVDTAVTERTLCGILRPYVSRTYVSKNAVVIIYTTCYLCISHKFHNKHLLLP